MVQALPPPSAVCRVLQPPAHRISPAQAVRARWNQKAFSLPSRYGPTASLAIGQAKHKHGHVRISSWWRQLPRGHRTRVLTRGIFAPKAPFPALLPLFPLDLQHTHDCRFRECWPGVPSTGTLVRGSKELHSTL